MSLTQIKSLFKYLETNYSISPDDIKYQLSGPSNEKAFSDWEKKHLCDLPEDLKHFFILSDGLNFKWSRKCGEMKVQIGSVCINPLKDIIRLNGHSDIYSDKISFLDLEFSDEENASADNHLPSLTCTCCRIFEFEPLEFNAMTVMVYQSCKLGVPARDPKFWLMDRSYRFHLIANDFKQYFRLLLLNLAITHWQFLYSNIGVPPQIKHVLQMYAPVRLELSSSKKSSALSKTSSDTINSIDSAKVFRSRVEKKKSPNSNPGNSVASASSSSINKTGRKPASSTPSRLPASGIKPFSVNSARRT